MKQIEPIHIISLGAGVQSSTMALMATRGEITPMPACAIFADTQDEPKSVYDWLNWLETQLPFKVHRVTVGCLSDNELSIRKSKITGKRYRKGAIPMFVRPFEATKFQLDSSRGILPRKCTRDFKIYPLIRMARHVASIPRGCKTVRVIQWMGISRDEAHRMKPSRHKYIKHRYPLVDMSITRQKCLDWMKANGYPTPPRSACVYCPYHSDAEWLRLKRDEPEEFAKAISIERKIQEASKGDEVTRGVPYMHSSRVPLDQVDFEALPPEDPQQHLWGNECEGMCGI